ncbi:tetratricopeptide repeat protein [Brumimicrobium sp.]|uniref:tetratricopeptide repeat protein n=1 Tax=Brumimicrobium sp. TaxID=2029867 RepID=UPI003A8DEE51
MKVQTAFLIITFIIVSKICFGQTGYEELKNENFDEAYKKLLPLANQDDSLAQFCIAMMYDAGKGLKQDQSMACHWYNKSGMNGHPIAQLYLGSMYESGQGCQQNMDSSLFWYQKAAMNGHPDGAFNLGKLYEMKELPFYNDSLSIIWYTKASELGHTRAMGKLAVKLFLKQDLIMAHVWSNIAAENDAIQKGTSTRILVEKYMTEEQIEEAIKIKLEKYKHWKELKEN